LNQNFFALPGTKANSRLIPQDGWIPARGGNWIFVSTDSPTFVINIPNIDADNISIGNRIRCYNPALAYFIVTAKAAAVGNMTQLTLYGGTDYTLTAREIYSISYSPVKSPFGFPLERSKWTVTFSDTTRYSQASPTYNVWYNLGSLSFSLPIGKWEIQFQICHGDDRAALGFAGTKSTISTGNNTESNPEFTHFYQLYNTNQMSEVGYRSAFLSLAAKTTFYINTLSYASSLTNIYEYNDLSALTVNAISQYL
jgi:hypothetical protein